MMTHKQFNLQITEEIQITIHFDLDFDGQTVTIQNIEFGNKFGILGTITHIFHSSIIKSINPEIYNDEVKEKIMRGILRIAEEETPKFGV